MPKLEFDLGLQRNGGNVRPGFLESSGLLGRSARDLHELFGRVALSWIVMGGG